jgi:ATP/maltotriose-dependent transcriptional regulator MalT
MIDISLSSRVEKMSAKQVLEQPQPVAATQTAETQAVIDQHEAQALMNMGQIARLLDASNKIRAQMAAANKVVHTLKEWTEYTNARKAYSEAVAAKCGDEKKAVNDIHEVITKTPQYETARKLSEQKAEYEKKAHKLASEAAPYVAQILYKDATMPPL